jgi:lipopolysaccharide transport system permease protein
MSQDTSITIIQPRKGWQALNVKELIEYRDLVYFWVLREIQILYKQTVLGILWAILRPVFSMIIFSIIFGRFAKIPSDGIPYPIFAYAALMPWTYFSQSVSKSTESLIQQASVISKIYFPRIIIPISPVIAGLLDFLLSFVVMIVMMIIYKVKLTGNFLIVPILILIMILTASGIGMWASALSIQYRDVRNAMQFFITLMMYASPVVWPISILPAKIRLFYAFYPMAGVIEGFRAALIGKNPIPWDLIGIGGLSALFLFISGTFYFQRMERNFADVA